MDACIAFDVPVSQELFAEGKELMHLYAVGQEGLRRSSGAVWLFGDGYVLPAGSAVYLPGVSIEEIRLVSS